MITDSAHATALEQLHRRAGDGESPSPFPIYPDLEAALREPAGEPDPTAAHVSAVCAGYSYSGAQTVADMMARMGLEGNDTFLVAEQNDAMFISSTAFLVQSADRSVVLLAYRGTQLFGPVSWLTDADLGATRAMLDLRGGAEPDAPATYGLHAGFARNVRATRFAVAEALDRALAGQSVIPGGGPGDPGTTGRLQRLYVTGHSLGGAMAAILAVMMVSEPDWAASQLLPLLGGVYTFGQPMVGTPQLAAAADADPVLGGLVFRYIHRRDPVPHVPPRDTGAWAHFGREFVDRGATPPAGESVSWSPTPMGGRAGQLGTVAELLNAVISFPVSLFPALRFIPFAYRIDDHRPNHYVERLTPAGVATEFGDYTYAP